MRGVAVVVGMLWLVGCRVAPPPAPRYPIAGQLLAVQLDTGAVVLKHGPVAGYMDAMTMPFRVADRASIRERRPGDLITATLVVDGERSYLEGVRLAGTAPLAGATGEAPPAIAYLTPGDTVPDAALVDHHGGSVSLTAWRGRAAVVTFIYTRCPLPDYCPLLDRRFAEVDRAAGADAALRDRVRLLSVSFDPATDTPDVLAAHAARLQASPRWVFATAPPATVDRFAAAFGVNVIREADTTITHNLRTAVIDPVGRVARVYSGNEFTAAELLSDLRAALAAASTP